MATNTKVANANIMYGNSNMVAPDGSDTLLVVVGAVVVVPVVVVVGRAVDGAGDDEAEVELELAGGVGGAGVRLLVVADGSVVFAGAAVSLHRDSSTTRRMP